MLFVVLPAYNEEAGLQPLLDDISKACQGIPLQIIVVNDASTDHTLQIARDYALNNPEVQVLSHTRNKGLGGSLMTGFKHVFAQRRMLGEQSGEWIGHDDVILTMDADNTHPAERIPLMAELIQQGADLVVASRYAPGGRQYGLNPLRQILSWGAGQVMTLFFPVEGLRDYSCGYRAYRASALESAYIIYGEELIESRSFAGMVELLVKVANYCREIREIPFDLHYEKKQGKSKMKILTTIMGYFALILRLKKEKWGWVEWVGE
ncbi:glycosyltransferase family 2 protein [Desulfitobacterium chlororespirans]|uniref:Dolichol-phosphate mannosyltransferase n=1 Tax=Desulfitobacterium chlororespirans DSM 11544 TaxID=1121395 RepID=A0A1M7U4Z5_9FIRM|nr:glycosyltransferase family 2 protein [Desulfitobacterium chlororespirans]SHN78111.1 dolichol-phosphate mannosyltransferase [Desulfitobacterium chlororespirans DSM 11544]